MYSKLEMEGKTQLVAARRPKSDWGQLRVEVPVLATLHGMHGTNAIALVYAQQAQC